MYTNYTIALAEEHRRDMLREAEIQRMIRDARPPKQKAIRTPRWVRSFRTRPRPVLWYRDWLTAGRL